eukprot:GHVT01034449.1.p1 GENE.GHVT01034449.1~~GHVT01034449.1.p1  ORF type:complete len:107 (+),score=12.38 GHVT01034449.1:168-488(+)
MDRLPELILLLLQRNPNVWVKFAWRLLHLVGCRPSHPVGQWLTTSATIAPHSFLKLGSVVCSLEGDMVCFPHWEAACPQDAKPPFPADGPNSIGKTIQSFKFSPSS